MVQGVHDHGTTTGLETGSTSAELASEIGVTQEAFYAAETQAMNNLQGMKSQFLANDGIVDANEEQILAEATANQMQDILGVTLDPETVMKLINYCKECWRKDLDVAARREGVVIRNIPTETSQLMNLVSQMFNNPISDRNEDYTLSTSAQRAIAQTTDPTIRQRV